MRLKSRLRSLFQSKKTRYVRRALRADRDAYKMMKLHAKHTYGLDYYKDRLARKFAKLDARYGGLGYRGGPRYHGGYWRAPDGRFVSLPPTRPPMRPPTNAQRPMNAAANGRTALGIPVGVPHQEHVRVMTVGSGGSPPPNGTKLPPRSTWGPPTPLALLTPALVARIRQFEMLVTNDRSFWIVPVPLPVPKPLASNAKRPNNAKAK